MPTITKPMPSEPLPVFNVKIQPHDIKNMLDVLGLDDASPAVRTQVIEALESDLKHHSHMLLSILRRPMPAHVQAELKPILGKAKALETIINPHKLSTKTYMNLEGAKVEELWLLLNELIVSVELALERTNQDGLSNGGARNQSFSQAYQAVMLSLEKFYDKNEKIPTDLIKYKQDYKADFIRYCQGYLPVMQNGKHGSARADF